MKNNNSNHQHNSKNNNNYSFENSMEDSHNLDSNIQNNCEVEKNEPSHNNIVELQTQIDEFKNKYLRSLAELENVKKYSTKQLEEANIYAINKFAKELLSVMDVFNKALTSINKEEITDTTFKSFISGIELTQQELSKIFKKFNISTLDHSIIGEQFNPVYHEALMSKEDNNQENNTIFEVYEPGYIIKDKLLRAAKVGIIKNS